MRRELIAYEARWAIPTGWSTANSPPTPGSPDPDWPPCQSGLDFQMVPHYFNADPEERVHYRSDLDEFCIALRDELSVDLRRQNRDFFETCGGDPAVRAAIDAGAFFRSIGAPLRCVRGALAAGGAGQSTQWSAKRARTASLPAGRP